MSDSEDQWEFDQWKKRVDRGTLSIKLSSPIESQRTEARKRLREIEYEEARG